MNLRQRLSEIGTPPTDADWAVIAARRRQTGWLLLVTSTGIACLPGCPARTPGRDRVRIVDNLEQALEAGARPCLRCRPDLPGWLEAHRGRRTSSHAAGSDATAPGGSAAGSRPSVAGRDGLTGPVHEATARLEAALVAGDDVPTDRDLAAGLGVSERRLRALFRNALGVTPRAWLAGRRSERLRARLLADGDVLSAAFGAGYGSSSAAYEAASNELGMPPGRYRSGGAGVRIHWTLAPTPDGLAAVATTERGLCAVRLGERVDVLEAELRAEFPLAELDRDDSGLADVAAVVADLAAGRRRPEAGDLALDVHATAFRRRVWEELRRIPAGETRSYGQVAASLGAPRAARAVGAACAANPVAVVVPCHRVIGADGSLHGYAYGLARKRRLLDAERNGAPPGEAPASTAARPRSPVGAGS